MGAGVLSGLLGGLLFLAPGLLRSGDFLAYWPSPGLGGWLIVRSVGLYAALGGVAGAVLGPLLSGILLLVCRRRCEVFPWAMGSMVAVTVLADLTAWWQIDVLTGLPMGDPERRLGAWLHGAAALALGAGTAGVLIWLRRRWGIAPGGRPRPVLVALAVATLLVLVADLGIHLSTSSRTATGEDDRPGRVVVVGLDGMTLRVLSPLLRAGEAPTFRRFVDEGAWGSFLTYGTASSPRVWTTMATGKRVRDHGIDDFVKATHTHYRAAPMRSFDRKSRAIWNILGDFGRRVGVVDWLITYPPEEVAGYVASRLKLDADDRTFPPELDAELGDLWGERPAGYREGLLWEADNVFTTAHHLLGKEPLDFLAVFDATIDRVEHRTWRDYRPERFDPAVWPAVEGRDPSLATLIPDVYRHLDRRLGELMDRLPDDALVIVVSDHGQLAARRPRVRLLLDRILERLGYAELAPAADGRDRVVYATSRAYTLVETPWTPTLRVNVNLAGRESRGIVPRDQALAVADRLVRDLRRIRFDDGGLLFSGVERRRHPARSQGRGADLRIALSRRARRSDAEARIRIADRTYLLSEFQQVNTDVSGDHDHQGVFFALGPGIAPGFVGQRAVPTALHDLVWHLSDKIDAVDTLLPGLRRLGLIDRASTLDLTPTVLHALGLPIARDMAGRALREIFATPTTALWIDSYETLPESPRDDRDAGSDEEYLERLRSLGYVS